MTHMSMELKYLTKSIMWELDSIAKKYKECENEEEKVALQDEFKQAAIHFNRQMKKEHLDILPTNASITTYSVEKYINYRNEDNWETI